jgi:hypothetical protein
VGAEESCTRCRVGVKIDEKGHGLAFSTLSSRWHPIEQYAFKEMYKRDYLLWAVRFQVSDWSRDTNRWICVEFRVSTEVHSRTVPHSGRRLYDHYRPVNSSLWFRKLPKLFHALRIMYMRLWAVETLTSIGICWSYNPSASIFCPFLSKSGGAPIRRLSTQGTPIGRQRRRSHSD